MTEKKQSPEEFLKTKRGFYYREWEDKLILDSRGKLVLFKDALLAVQKARQEERQSTWADYDSKNKFLIEKVKARVQRETAKKIFEEIDKWHQKSCKSSKWKGYDKIKARWLK